MVSGSLMGMEVPITGTDQLKWIDVSVPSSSPTHPHPYAPLTEDSTFCHIIQSPTTYLTWRIHKDSPNSLEIIELVACNQVPKFGLRLQFNDALSPFAFICKDEMPSMIGKNTYLLYAMTVTGIAYLFKLRNVVDYTSCTVVPQNEFMEFDLQSFSMSAPITVVTATRGCLIVGRYDGSISCFQLGVVDASVNGFMRELRDDVGIGRLWGLMSRGRIVAPVQDMVVSELHGRKLLFVVHMDGNLRAWDLLSQSRVLSHTIDSATYSGCTVSRLWVGDINQDRQLVSLALLCTSTEADLEKIVLFGIHLNLGDKVSLSPGDSLQTILLEEGGFIDLKITSSKLWLLKEDGLVLYDYLHDNFSPEEANSYHLQETFVADQLFQSSEHSLDDLSWTSLSLSSVKDHIVPFVSSIFLRRLLHPGIYQTVALRSTAHDYNKHWSDSEFQSLTIDGLKKEIFSLIENEVIAPMSIINCWKKFCTRYFHYWCKTNAPYGLLIDQSTGAVGLIRKNSLSLFRCLEDIEQLIYGSFDEFGNSINSGLYSLNDVLDREVLFEVLRCISSINQHLGKAAASIFYESLVNAQMISSEEIVPGFLKILETGYSSAVAKLYVSQLGADVAWKKELEDHKNQRKFSIDMTLSLHALLGKATSWDRILNVIEKYLTFLVPRKSNQPMDAEASFNINSSVLVLSASQVARVMFESAFDILLLLGYLVNAGGQVHMKHDDISRIQLQLIPMIQDILTEWVILHFLGTTPSESPALEDFSTRLSSLHIDSNTIKRSWNEKLGTCDFTVACLLYVSSRNSSEDQTYISSRFFPGPNDIICSVQNFSSWIIWGGTGEESSSFFNRSIELGKILLKHGQYEVVENLFGVVHAHSRREKTSESVQGDNGEWSTHHHLLGFSLLARAQREPKGVLRERKVREAVRCFFRASSGQGASHALQSLSFEGLPHLSYTAGGSDVGWKLHYYQWAMQMFEQYCLSEGACQFALAALEQVDEIDVGTNDIATLNESATTVRGRLWANVFKFTLDLSYYYDAYCAIISNPDEESKKTCLRRFIFVLCERGAFKTLCDGQLPFVGLTEKLERELAWNAERSDVGARPNPYKLLYAFETHRHNWRKAASYMYRYSSRLRSEVAWKEHQYRSVALQERLNALSASINALSLVHPAYAWIDPQLDDYSSSLDNTYPNKKARKIGEENSLSNAGAECWRLQYCVDIEKLEKEYVQTSAEYLLSVANVKLKYKESGTEPSDLVDLLVETNLYDMAFTVLLKFWKDSGLKREIERVFVAIALKCCPNWVGVSHTGLLLRLSEDEPSSNGPAENGPLVQAHQSLRKTPWETLELYLEKYKKLHPRLPVIVAETLLRSDSQIELPLWLVDMFKGGGRKAASWGMTGFEADPASLFRLYVNYGRLTEATNLLLEYIESFSSLRPADIIHRKKMSAIWFPYTTIERLWCQVEEISNSGGYMADQCDKLKRILHGALLTHLQRIKVDSRDTVSSATC